MLHLYELKHVWSVRMQKSIILIRYMYDMSPISPIYVPLYISMITKYLYVILILNYFISIYKYMVFYIYIYIYIIVIHCYI